jgi:hypothetical protein
VPVTALRALLDPLKTTDGFSPNAIAAIRSVWGVIFAFVAPDSTSEKRVTVFPEFETFRIQGPCPLTETV